MTDKSELLTATDETIDDAVKYANPMVLRGLLYQLTGDESIGATKAATADIRHSEPGNASKELALVQSKADVSDPSDVAMIQSKAAAFLKSYRDRGAPRFLAVLRSASLAALALPLEAIFRRPSWKCGSSNWPWIRGLGDWFGRIRHHRRIYATSSWL